MKNNQNSLSSLEPAPVWKIFSNICSIPHISKHEDKLVEYLYKFASNMSFDICKDAAGNVLIKKNATSDALNNETIILQAHLDMVPQKNKDCDFDFLVDSIKPYIDGPWVKASGTTLGADNGIGISLILSILESQDISHGPIEALFTVDEEVGMCGAQGLSQGFFHGRQMINLDSENTDEIVIGCAGGKSCIISSEYTEETLDKPNEYVSITVSGCKGGHSGVDIHLGRANAIKLLVRVLHECNNVTDLRISSLDGGTISNAIPREATANITVPAHQLSLLENVISQLNSSFIQEFTNESDIRIVCTKGQHNQNNAIPLPFQKTLLDALHKCPNGVLLMDQLVHGSIELSMNIGRLFCQKGKFSLKCFIRFSNNNEETDVESFFPNDYFKVTLTKGFPSWNADLKSVLLKKTLLTYEKTFSRKAVLRYIHAGLECGIIASKFPSLEIVSIGPKILDAHSPDEKVLISSVENCYKFLVEILRPK